ACCIDLDHDEGPERLMLINDGAAGLGDAAGVFTEIGGPTMATPIRVAMLVAGLLVFGALPAVAQQAAPGASINPPATAAPEAAQALPDATAELGTAIQELQREVYALGKAARERAAALAGGGPPIVLSTDQLIAIAGGALVGAIV